MTRYRNKLASRISVRLALFCAIFGPFVCKASPPQGDNLLAGRQALITFDFSLSPELKARAEREKNRIIKEGRFGYTRTNPDGIIVSLEVRDEKLWVTSIGISGGRGGYEVEPTVIPTNIVKEPLEAEWFTGKLTGYFGKRLLFHIHEFGREFRVEEGEIVSEKEVRFVAR